MSIQTASAGRVLLKFKGNWSTLGSYAPLDCTYHSGSTYVCKNNVSSSTTPDQDTTNWQILASGFDAAAVTALKNQITTGSSFAFVIGSTTYTDVESALGALKALYDGEIGTLSSLTTTDKSSLVSAINEVKSAADTASNKVGTLTNLTTTSKTDTVSAINEVKSAADSASTKVGTLSNLTTTAKTDAVSAINEVKGLADSAGSAASTASTKVGTLSNLTTTAKTDAVSAINEVDEKLSKTEVLISNVESSIATVQTTLTASKNYAVGEQFVYNGLLYEVTQTIASGGTITIGGNCALADSVTKQIADCVANANNRMPTYNITVQSGTIREIFSDLANRLEALNIGVTPGIAYGVITGKCFFTYQFFRYASYEMLGILTLGEADNVSYIANRTPSTIVIKEISATAV